MNEPLHLTAEASASKTLEAFQSFETFYDAESRPLFRRLWLVTGNRAGRRRSCRTAFANLVGRLRGLPCADPRCYSSLGSLEVAASDGTHLQGFAYAYPGPWNPLVQPEPEVAEVPAASEGLALSTTLPPVVALVALFIGGVFVRRRIGRSAGSATGPKHLSAS
jgi:hypothetical protein